MYLGGMLHMWIVKHVRELVAFKVLQGGKRWVGASEDGANYGNPQFWNYLALTGMSH